jgi:hypothetical protein
LRFAFCGEINGDAFGHSVGVWGHVEVVLEVLIDPIIHGAPE